MNTRNFGNIIAYVFGEPGAMGSPCEFRFYTDDGKKGTVYYDMLGWEKTKDLFPEIDGCRFNGLCRNESITADSVAVGFDPSFGTTLNPGWTEIAFDCGNHFAVRDEYLDKFKEFAKGKYTFEIEDLIEENHFLGFDWCELKLNFK